MSADESAPPSAPPCILVTGGCGYIGTHTITCLLTSPAKYSVVVLDNLSNSSRVSLDRVAEITGLKDKPDELKSRLIFHEVDLCDKDAMRKVFEQVPSSIPASTLPVSRYVLVVLVSIDRRHTSVNVCCLSS